MKTAYCTCCGRKFETNCDGGYARCPYCSEITTTEWKPTFEDDDDDIMDPDEEDQLVR